MCHYVYSDEGWGPSGVICKFLKVSGIYIMHIFGNLTFGKFWQIHILGIHLLESFGKSIFWKFIFWKVFWKCIFLEILRIYPLESNAVQMLQNYNAVAESLNDIPFVS